MSLHSYPMISQYTFIIINRTFVTVSFDKCKNPSNKHNIFDNNLIFKQAYSKIKHSVQQANKDLIIIFLSIHFITGYDIKKYHFNSNYLYHEQNLFRFVMYYIIQYIIFPKLNSLHYISKTAEILIYSRSKILICHRDNVAIDIIIIDTNPIKK